MVRCSSQSPVYGPISPPYGGAEGIDGPESSSEAYRVAYKNAKLSSFMLCHGVRLDVASHLGPFIGLEKDKKKDERPTPASIFHAIHGIAVFERERLTEQLKKEPFSLMIQTGQKTAESRYTALALVVRYIEHSAKKQKDSYWQFTEEKKSYTAKTYDDLLAIVNVPSEGSEELADEIGRVFNERGIPWENCVAMACEDQQALEILKNRHGNMVCVNFMCRSVESCHLRALASWTRPKVGMDDVLREMLSDVEKFLAEISSYSDVQGKLEPLFNLLKKNASNASSSILHPLKVTHLSLLKTVLENWDELRKFFEVEAFDEQNREGNWLFERFQPRNPTRVVLDFCKWQFEKVSTVDKKFCSDTPIVFGILAQMRDFFVNQVLKRFMKPDSRFFCNEDGSEKTFGELDVSWLYDGSKIWEIPDNLQDCLVSVEDVFLGHAAEQAAKHLSQETVLIFRRAVREYYIQMAFNIAERFDLRDDSPYATMELLNPFAETPGRFQHEAVEKLVDMFTPKVFKLPPGSNPVYLKGELMDVWDEYCWRKVDLLSSLREKEAKGLTLRFWRKVFEEEKALKEPPVPMFPLLRDIGWAAMVFPHTTKRVDEIFCRVNRFTDATTIPLILSLAEDRFLAKQVIDGSRCCSNFMIPTAVVKDLAGGTCKEKFKKLCESKGEVVGVDEDDFCKELEEKLSAGWNRGLSCQNNGHS